MTSINQVFFYGRKSTKQRSIRVLLLVLACIVFSNSSFAQEVHEVADSVVLSNGKLTIKFDQNSGKVSYRFIIGTCFNNTIAYVEDVQLGYLSTNDFDKHSYTIDEVEDPLGKGKCINLIHETASKKLRLIQHITLYREGDYILISAEAETTDAAVFIPETRNISPLAVLPAQQAACIVKGKEPRLVDFPFDNDNWVDVLAQKWPGKPGSKLRGISYELASVHDEATKNGFVIGSLLHDFWKTGIRYVAGDTPGQIDSMIVYGGAAIKDDPSLPASQGGYDGTHDYIAHGTAKGAIVRSPLIFLSASADVRQAFGEYGALNAKISGSLKWKGYAPVYWNSFGVEGVLGYTKVMMPAGVVKVSDFIHTMDNFNKYAKPVLSIDSYDQGIYSTAVLSSISKYGKKKDQQMGFYFIPFALWTWKNGIDQNKLAGSDYMLRDIILKDSSGKYIPYKNGDWAAFPLDPTHPATRLYIINQLEKAKAINARFIKIDFLSAGALESASRFDPSVRSGIQAYNQGMKMLKSLVDSIMGPDIFISMAISPMFPHQYAHTRFVSTDVYSHLRNDQPGFPHYGSTSASMISASHLWWVQGTLWPYTNMDVAIMKNFQNNKDLTTQEIKVRLYSMITLGSILGDGSDMRNKIATERAQIFLNNPAVCKFFSNPKAFIPLRFSEGQDQGQQLSFYLPGDTSLVSVFNFNATNEFTEIFLTKDIGLLNKAYLIKDFLTGEAVGKIEKGQSSFSLNVSVKDALLVKLVPVND